MKQFKIGALYILMVFCALPSFVKAQQQGLPVDGRDFYLGFVNPTFNNDPPQLADGDFRGFFGMFALISSYTNNTAFVSYFDPVSGVESAPTAYSIFGKQGIIVPLSRPKMEMADSLGDVPEYRACHITAKQAVNVQYFSSGACAGGSYLSIPTPALGKSYVVPSYWDNPGTGAGQSYQAENAGGFFLIIATTNNTSVTITPNGRTAKGHIGVSSGAGATGLKIPYTIFLQRGQCYMVKGDGSDPDNDMSGSTVVSDKPIGVLGGHEDAFFGEAPNSSALDGRDYMVEQVIPAEYWDSTGYVSIPMVGGNPIDESRTGYGQNYRVYTNDPKGAAVDENDCIRGHNPMAAGLYAYPTPERGGVGCPIEMHSTDGHKFGVMCYEQRDQGTAEPFPSESMMSIVPMSRWRTSYLFYVPANIDEILQDYYINVIGEINDINNNIVFAHNGGSLQKLSAIGASRGVFLNIPNHPELKGARFVVHPGSYYLTNPRTTLDPTVAVDTMLHGSFMVYHYGMRALDPDFDLGDFCGDDFFFSYALPIGMTVSAGTGHPVVTVDTLCSSFHVCVHDFVPLTSATLIDDPNGDVYGRPGKVYHNVNFDATSDPNQTREIIFNGNDTSVCFDVLVSNPFDTAYAPLYIVDRNGYHLDPILELRYKAPSVSELLEVPQTPPLPDTYIKIDTLQYGVIGIGAKNEVCSTLVFINTAPKGSKSFNITDAFMQNKADSNFTIDKNAIVPKLPVALQGGDTLRVTICFTATDTLSKEDSVILTTDCFNAPLLATGKGGTPLIYATDYDFGNVIVGTSSCHDVIISNRGNLPFTLTKNFLLHNTTVFSLSAQSLALLPYVLQPGTSVKMTFCYSPTAIGPQDSTSVDWNTDIESPYTDQIKSWSYLKGSPIKPGLVWDRLTELDSVICEDSNVVRVNLTNKGNATASQVKVFFNGPDAAEYSIIDNQLGYTPLQGFDMAQNQTIWVDVRFKADLTKGFAPRHANLLATSLDDASQSQDTTLIAFTGLVQRAQLSITPQLLNLGFINKGQPEGGFIIVVDTGDAPFVFKSADFPNPPIIADSLIRDSVTIPIVAGDTIYKGDTVKIHVLVQLDSYTDTTVQYTLFSDHICGDYTASIEAAASNLSVLATDYPAPDVFINCREHDSSVVFINKGSIKVVLDSVDLSGLTPPGQFDLIDSKGNKGQSIALDDTLQSQGRAVIKIVYHPSQTGPASGTIRFIYDSAGFKRVITTQATGNGIALQTTLSAAQPSGQPFAGVPNSNFVVPISLANTPLPTNADARRVTFRLTYRQDVVNYQSAQVASQLRYNMPAPPVRLQPGNGDETLDFDISAVAPYTISNLEDIVDITYTVMVSKEEITPFVISNVTFYDATNTPICYIAADTIPSAFIPLNECGDTTLRDYLHGVLPTRISMLSPDIVPNNVTPVLYYSVNKSDIPVKVEIYNVLGEMVRTVKNTMTQPVGNYRLPVGTRGLPSGTYMLRMTTPTSSQTVNFIIQN